MDAGNDVGVGIFSTDGRKLQPAIKTVSKHNMLGRIFFFIISSVAFMESICPESLCLIG
jgi:hypothetical protein